MKTFEQFIESPATIFGTELDDFDYRDIFRVEGPFKNSSGGYYEYYQIGNSGEQHGCYFNISAHSEKLVVVYVSAENQMEKITEE